MVAWVQVVAGEMERSGQVEQVFRKSNKEDLGE